MAKGHPTPIAAQRRIIKLYRQGKTCQQIADLTGCGHVTVWRYVQGISPGVNLSRLIRAKESPIHLTPTQRAYLAGLTDGEGCIAIYKDKRPPMQYTASFCIAMTDRIVPLLRKETGLGTIRQENRSGNHKPIWFWRIRSYKLAPFLRLLLPYLRCKKAQAELVIELLEMAPLWTAGWRDRNPALAKRMEEIHLKMKYLNRRGRLA